MSIMRVCLCPGVSLQLYSRYRRHPMVWREDFAGGAAFDRDELRSHSFGSIRPSRPLPGRLSTALIHSPLSTPFTRSFCLTSLLHDERILSALEKSLLGSVNLQLRSLQPRHFFLTVHIRILSSNLLILESLSPSVTSRFLRLFTVCSQWQLRHRAWFRQCSQGCAPVILYL